MRHTYSRGRVRYVYPSRGADKLDVDGGVLHTVRSVLVLVVLDG